MTEVPNAPGVFEGLLGGGSGGFDFDPSLLLRLLPQRMSPLDQLRARVLEMELAEKAGRELVVCDGVMPEQAVPRYRCDHVVLGDRDTGKTALAVWLAQRRGTRWYLVDASMDVARSLGGDTWGGSLGEIPNGATVVLDESRMRTDRRPREVWSAMALARQRQQSMILVSQSGAAIPPDAWRHSVRLWWRRYDARALQFEREELREEGQRAAAVLRGCPDPFAATWREGDRWHVTVPPLPVGWTDAASRLWA